MMKLLVALHLLATSVEGLNTKKQVALKKPLLLRGGAFGAKTALLAQTAGLTALDPSSSSRSGHRLATLYVHAAIRVNFILGTLRT